MTKKELEKAQANTQLQNKKLREIIKNLFNNNSESIEELTDIYENQLKVQDLEMRRLNIIIDNYEVKLNITIKEEK